MNGQIIFAYIIAMLTGLFGAALLGGYLDNRIPDRLRITLGIVLLLMSIYRLTVTTLTINTERND